jgi:hypothetical protein
MKNQIVTTQEFYHYNDIQTDIEIKSGYRLIHFTTTIRADNSAVMVLLLEKENNV